MTDSHDENGNKARVTFLTWLIGMTLTIMLVAVPWAFFIQGNVSAMQVDIRVVREKIESIEIPPSWFLAQVNEDGKEIDDLQRDMIDMKVRMMRLEERQNP